MQKERRLADARFRATFNGDMSDTFNYEWWLWDNIPLKYWVIIQDKLCFVTEDNRLCSFYDGFSDYISDELLVSIIDGRGVTISAEYANYNRIKFDVAYKECVPAVASITDGAIVVDTEYLYTKLNEGDVVYFDATGINGISEYSPISASAPYTVRSIDIAKGEVTFVDADGISVPFTASMNSLLHSNPLRISKAADKEYSLMINTVLDEDNAIVKDDDEEVKFVKYNGIESYSATLYKKKSVEAYWQTGSYDFGSSLYAKTIEKFSIAFDRESPKSISLYYNTANRGKQNLIDALKQSGNIDVRALTDSSLVNVLKSANVDNLIERLKTQKDFDLANMSLVLFTFNQRFETSFTKNFLVRNFNYISFMLVSDSDEDFAVNSVSFVYKVNRANRGEV